jgi:hypothetical protein
MVRLGDTKAAKRLTVEELLAQKTTATKQPLQEIVLLGAPGHGKTRLSLTISEHCPEELPAEEEVVLKDCIAIAGDPGYHDTVRGCNLVVPCTSGLETVGNSWDDYYKRFKDEVDSLKPLVDAGLAKNVFVDTFTHIVSQLVAMLAKQYKKKEGSKADMYGELGYMVKDLRHAVHSLGCRIIWIGHIKPYADWAATSTDATAKKQAKARQEAFSLPGFADLVADLPPSSARIFKASASLFCSVVRAKAEKPKDPRAQRGPDVFTLHCTSHKIEGKTRYPQLEGSHKPNLKKLLELI